MFIFGMWSSLTQREYAMEANFPNFLHLIVEDTLQPDCLALYLTQPLSSCLNLDKLHTFLLLFPH